MRSIFISARACAQTLSIPALAGALVVVGTLASPASAQDAEAAPDTAVAATATISVNANPSGRVYLDGVDTGLDTPVANLEVTPGAHTLKVVELSSGREKEISFELDSGNNLNLNINLPAVEKAVPTTTKAPDPAKTDGDTTGGDKAADPSATAEEDIDAIAAAAPADDWTWMTVAGWSGLGLGAIGLATGAVVLTTPAPDQAPLGFALFGTGAGLVLGGGVLLYLDSELNGEGGLFNSGDAPADDADGEAEGEKAASLPSRSSLALVE